METVGNSEDGNTKQSSSRIVPSKYWLFTWNNYPENYLETLETVFNKFSIKYIFGEEKAPTTGTLHIQGYIECDKKIRPIEFLKLPTEISWRKRSERATREDNINYCSKEGKNIKTNFLIKKPLKDPLEGLTLKQWQIEINEIIKKEPDNRKIYWYWEETGGIGKTSFVKSLCIKKPNEVLVLGGKASDIKHGIVKFLEKEDNELNIAIFHFVRSQEEFISYEALEAVKDGIFFSGKFESGMCIFNTPHIFVFSNFPPDESKMSKDRWIIKNIKEEELIQNEPTQARPSSGSLSAFFNKA